MRWLTGRRIAWLTVLFAIVIVIAAAVSTQGPDKECDSGSYARQESCYYLLSLRQAAEWVNSGVRTDGNDKLVVAYGTGIIAVFTSVLGIFTVRLWSATRELVRGGERTARRQLRAYVGITDVRVSPLIVGEKPHITFATKNFGQTPAYRVRSWLEIKCLPNPMVDDMPTLPLDAGKRVLNPDEAFSVDGIGDDPITEPVLEAVNVGTIRLYLWGLVYYRDAFSHDRTTEFRFEYTPRLKQMSYSDEGNDAT